ncbi:maleylpyruvate isomerase family mycothiol-dependent enzyme [Amycolatopsis sp. K13G38]|uniref:Maleylpyruvate isomerase family mycothiol-dependent enzyme n=1 Tax=Amycolatopsis acididurans TaxID=2724524 RepID=A0ABX1J5J9_9PSEU|nr:maleylpyruvate isomerase family mycothiol-dependent enzyme [Amycolatopsis acididurans]NKQ55083.1 maleylpyruvate isomerase family mycothiol-dependent enzyme [Amycolatopsis acididurans]
MRHADFLTAIGKQCDSLRAAALTAGPDAEVPSCPGWTVSRLVAHLARVQSWVRKSLADPSGRDVKADRPPQAWDELLPWWDEQRTEMIEGLTDPDVPAWLPFTRYPQVTGSWARRQAHEAAIHRLDAELACGPAPSLLFDSEFAADGIDELLAWLVPTRGDWSQSRAAGSVVVHAADAGRTWTVVLEPGSAPRVEDGGLDGDVVIAGTADAVYRRVWRRPSEAKVTGNTALLEPLAGP